MEKISFKFTGGIANEHQLNFYEAGRFQYGAARLIYTLARFQQDGKILSRLTSKVDVDIRVNASRRGSFEQEILIYAKEVAPVIGTCLLNVTFEALIAYAMDKLLPKSKGNEIAVDIAKIELERDREDTKQEAERTKQIELYTSAIERGYATTSQALDIIKLAIEDHGPTAEGVAGHTISHLEFLKNDLESQQAREQIISENIDQFSKIDKDAERKLAGQMRKTMVDISLPLRNSATEMFILGESKTPIATLDEDRVKMIVEVDDDLLPTVIRGHIKSYDVESGVGRFRYNEHPTPLSFRVPSALRELLREEILDSMKRDDVLISAYFVRDSYGNPTGLLLDKILEDEDYDKNNR